MEEVFPADLETYARVVQNHRVSFIISRKNSLAYPADGRLYLPIGLVNMYGQTPWPSSMAALLLQVPHNGILDHQKLISFSASVAHGDKVYNIKKESQYIVTLREREIFGLLILIRTSKGPKTSILRYLNTGQRKTIFRFKRPFVKVEKCCYREPPQLFINQKVYYDCMCIQNCN